MTLLQVHPLERSYNAAAHAYCFHVSILGVNKTIHEEAAREMLVTNRFVKISYVYNGLRLALQKSKLPLVTLGRQAHEHLPECVLEAQIQRQCRGGSHPEHSPRYAVIVAADLPTFCRFMTFHMLCEGSKATYILG